MKTTSSSPAYELFAINYARNPRRTAHESFLYTHDMHDGPLPMDFFVWAAHCEGRVILIDAGADKEVCTRRGHDFIRCPTEGLRLLGFKPEQVSDVIVTHMHWDHMGNFDKFPNARFHVHPLEMNHATGPCMCHPFLRRPYDADQVCSMIQALYRGRVFFSADGEEVVPGITTHHMGGHTPGLQVARVPTARGLVVVASDAMHYYANAESGNPFPVVVNVDQYLKASKLLYRLAPTPEHVVAGHDPVVLDIYPAPSPALQGIAVRLDTAPVSRR